MIAAPTTVTNRVTETVRASVKDWKDQNATIGLGTAPPFPTALEGWRRVKSWNANGRAFPDTWTATAGSSADQYNFPATMNGCDQQRFLVRWRVVDSGGVVDASSAYIDGQPDQLLIGSAGWFDVDGCTHPEFRADPRSGHDTHW